MTLLLIKDLGTRRYGKNMIRFGIYECECGDRFKTATSRVKFGGVNNCRKCAYKIATLKNTVHGMADSRLYAIWEHIKSRCNNVNDDSYFRYGGRGIKVCKEWLNFIPFMKWANANGYSDDLTIERKDNDAGYCATNCTWATLHEQCFNKRIRTDNTSGYEGVIIRYGRYASRVEYNNKTNYLGVYDTAIEAVTVRDKFILKNNFPHKLQVLTK